MIEELLQKKVMEPCSKNYVKECFLKQHSHLTTKFSLQVKKQRILSSDPSIFCTLLAKLGKIVKDFNNLLEITYNMHEKAITYGKKQRVKLICMRERYSSPLMKNSDSELTTVIESIGRSGVLLPPMVIYQGHVQYR